MTPARLDPRTIPRSDLLEALGARRPRMSIVVLCEAAARAADLAGLRRLAERSGTQLIVARRAGDASDADLRADLDQLPTESLAGLATRAGARAIGRLLMLLPSVRCDGAEAALLLAERLEPEPWLGCLRLPSGEDVDGLLTPERLWTALAGFDAEFHEWSWGLADFCMRARAIGYAAAGGPVPRAVGDRADRARFAERLRHAPDRSTLPPAPPGRTVRVDTYTAIIEGYDTLKPQPAAAVEREPVAFVDETGAAAHRANAFGWRLVASGAPEADPHRRARFHKINAHLALPDAEYSLWIDASIGIVCPFPLSRLVDLFLGEHDLCVFRHHARRSIYDEAEACKAAGRDRPDVIDAQIARYRACGLPHATGLIEAPILLRRHSPAMRRLNEAWWQEVARGSRRDQLSFNYVAWRQGFAHASFPLSLAASNGLFVKFRR